MDRGSSQRIMSKKLTVCVTGDSHFVANMPDEYEKDLQEVAEFIDSGDIRITNLETNVSPFGDFANAYSGGSWLNTEPEVFDDLTRFGFNYYGTANNHCMDYSYHGLLSTIDELDKRGLAHSGTGRNLEEASAPAIIEAGGQKIAIFAVTCAFNDASKAGWTTKRQKGRPGVNYVGSQKYYPIDSDDYEALKRIAKKTNVNGREDFLVSNGFSLPEAKGVFNFGNVKFCYDGSKKLSECNKKDKARLLSSIESAVKTYEYVFILIHSHDVCSSDPEEVPQYYEELAHACIDAGVAAVIGGGIHQLRPIEIYKGRPIFYSLGDFIFQGSHLPILPADFMEKYGVDINATAEEGFAARSKGGKIGLATKKCNFLSVVPKMEFDGGKLTSLTMMPTNAGFGKEWALNGLPYYARGDEGKEIFGILDRLSKPYGTELIYENNMIKAKLK